MTFAGKEQCLAESAVERRLKARDAGCIEAFMIGGELGEALEIDAVTRMRHHERAR